MQSFAKQIANGVFPLPEAAREKHLLNITMCFANQIE
jgi:hypothetical protein